MFKKSGGKLGNKTSKEAKISRLKKDNAVVSLFRDISRIFTKTGRRLERKWAFSADAPITTSLTSDLLYPKKRVIAFATKNGKVYVLNENAKVEWTYDIKEKFTATEMFFMDKEMAKNIYSAPILADINNDKKNEVIFGSENGKLYSLDAGGKLLWSYKTKGSIRAMPVAEDINNDGKLEIIFGSKDKLLYVLNAEGKLLWKFKAGSEIEAPVAVFKGRRTQIIFGTNNGIIYSVDNKGKEIWQFRTNGKITAQPAIGDIYNDRSNYIIIGSCDNCMYALTEKGKLKWKYQTEGNIFSKACLADINNDNQLEIIFGSCDDNIYALSAKGDKIWSYETDFWVVATPLVADINNDGRLEVIAGSYDRKLYVLDGEGSFLLDYMPGIEGITQQTGHYNELNAGQPGSYHGKKLFELETDGMIVASCLVDEKKSIIIGMDNGKLNFFVPTKN